MHPAGRSVIVAALLIVAGCSPTFDWREVQSANGLVSLFPCRPQTHSRRLLLGGEPVTMELSSCTAGELTFAVGYLEVDEATRVEAVKQVLRNALRVNMSLPASTTPLAGEAAQTVDGTGPDGKPLRAQSRIFSNSTSVFQVTVFGPQLKAEPVDFFFSSIKPPA